jgi:hypothetical protein
MSVPAHIMIQPGSWSTSAPQVRRSIDVSHDAALVACACLGPRPFMVALGDR